MKNIAVLGCTGSIGSSALKVIENDPEMKVGLLTNNSDLKGLKLLIEKFRPHIAICREADYLYVDGKEGVITSEFSEDGDYYSDFDIVVNGIVGLSGLKPSLAVLRAGKILATANKESFVCAGTIINSYKEKYGGKIYPLDSEHSAIWQLIDGGKNIKSVILTASGGAFRDLSKEELSKATAERALKHPNWIMGKKVTVDCATLLNKGMEIMEAKHLFGLPVEVLGHRESIIHSLVRFADGTLHANISAPDMTIPIAYALKYPEPAQERVSPDLAKIGSLNFFELDEKRFPCLSLAKQAAKCGDIAGCVLNAADEILVGMYLKGEIGFYDISDGVARAMDKFATNGDFTDEDEVFRMDSDVREYTLKAYFGGKK